MNLKQAKIILEKINRLYQSMTLDEKHIDIFEQDLMLSYIRQLYGAFSSEEMKQQNKKDKKLPKVEPLPKIPKAEEPKPASPKAPPPPKAEEAPSRQAVEKVEPVPSASAKEKAKPAPKADSGAEYEALFEHKEASDLSEKLSQAPIRNLTKAMGLNEKIFTINELFGGEKEVFNEAMKTLDTFTTFEEAKAYLSRHIAHKYNWARKNKKNKAKNLIKLIRRRYN